MAKEDNQAVKSRRDSFSERLQSKYPDREFADDEALFGQISDDYDEYDDALQSIYDNRNKIAHGENSNVGVKSLEDCYHKIQEFFVILVKTRFQGLPCLSLPVSF